MNSLAFLSLLFGDAVCDRSMIVVFSDKRSAWSASAKDAAASIESLSPHANTYFGCALQDPEAALVEANRREAVKAEREKRPVRQVTLAMTRGFATTAVAIGGAWVDLDVTGGGHDKAGLPTSLAQIHATLDKLPLLPTARLETGGGVHAWWFFREPWTLETPEERARAERILRGWQREVARVGSFTVDPTADLARVMRTPGTLNHKFRQNSIGGMVVCSELVDDRAFNPSDFDQWEVLDKPEQARARGPQDGGACEAFLLDPEASPPPKKLEVMKSLDVRFARTWARQRAEFPSQSEYDLALATMASHAGWSVQETVDLMVAHRRMHNQPAKLRVDYYQNRIALARAGNGRIQAGDGVDAQRLQQVLPTPVLPSTTPATAGPETTRTGPSWPAPPDPEAFHGLAGKFVRMIDPHTEADRTAVLVQFLIGFGGVVGRAPYFRVGGARHGLNEFAVLVGRTSKARKGTSWEDTRELLKRADSTWAKNCIVRGLSSGEGLIWQVRDEIVVREKVKGEYKDVVKDAGVDDKRLLVIEAEFASPLRRMGGETNSLSSMLRCAWDDGDLRTLVKNNPARATEAHISLIGHVTKDELLRELDRTEMGNGFANRIMFFCVTRSKCLPEGGHLSDGERNPILAALHEAIRFARTTNEVRRDDEARKLWANIYPGLSEGKPGLLGAVIGRAEAHVLRLSLIYALLDCSKVIRLEHLVAALKLWEHSERSSRFIFGEALGDPFADEVLRLLRSNPEGLSKTDLYAAFGRHPSARRLDGALRLLLEQALVAVATVPTAGRPAEVWSAREVDRTGDPPLDLSSLSSLPSRSPSQELAARNDAAVPDGDSIAEPLPVEDELVERVRREFHAEVVDDDACDAPTGARATSEATGDRPAADPVAVKIDGSTSVCPSPSPDQPAKKANKAKKGSSVHETTRGADADA